MNKEFGKDVLQPFDPGDPRYRWKLVARVVYPERVQLHFFWRRIAKVAAAAGLGCWLLAAGGIWAFLVFGRDWADAKYSDLALYPWRATEFKKNLARHNLARGQIEFANKNYRYGYALLVAGLGRFPSDLRARQTVATIQVRSGLLPRALDTLVQGMDYAPDLDYLKLTFGWLHEAQQFDRVVALAERVVPRLPDHDLKHRFVALQAASSHFACGRFDQAEQWIGRWGLGNALEGVVLRAQIEWETGFKDRALQRLSDELGRFSHRDELYLHLVRFHREMGNESEARRFALLRQFNEPRSPGPRIDLLHAYRATGDGAAEEREIAAYLSEFGGDPKALAGLAWFAADTHQDSLLDRLCIWAAERNCPTAEFDLARVQLALVKRRFSGALELSAPAVAASARMPAGPLPLVVGLNAVANFASGDAMKAGLAVKAFVAQDRIPPQELLLLARELRLVGDESDARAVLERACGVDGGAQPAMGELIRIDAQTKNHSGLQTYLPKYLALRKPSREVLTEAALALDRVAHAALFAQIRSVLQGGSATGRPGEANLAAVTK